jgi:DNA-directed RNA polymerase III subunit RPC8
MHVMQIRFRVRTINFTRVTTTAKGITATVTSETHSGSGGGIIATSAGVSSAAGASAASGGGPGEAELLDLPGVPPVRRKRSTSFDLDKEQEAPSAMQIIGCINEDGLGLTAWWE